MQQGDASIVVAVVVLASAFSVALMVFPENAIATTLFVGGMGAGNFTSIQGAIDAAMPGDTIFVFNGAYFENVLLHKTLTLIGEDKENTIVQGDPDLTDTIQIVSDWVNVTGFTAVGSKVGIELDFVEHCRIVNTNVYFNELIGISLRESRNNYFADIGMKSHELGGIYAVLSDNNVYVNISASQNGGGIVLSPSSNNVIIGGSGLNGIVSGGANNTILNNSMISRGIGLMAGGDLDMWTSHLIDTSNTVGGKPVYYWKNTAGGRIPSDAGQVILANCTDVLVENFDFTNLTKGIQLGYSSKNTIANSTISRNWFQGLYLYQSSNNTIVNNDFSHNTDQYEWLWLDYSSVHLDQSDDNTFENNTVLSNNGSGMNLEFSHGNRISRNTFSGNNWSGLGIYRSERNIVEGNTISSNMNSDYHYFGHSGGLVLTFSDGTTVVNNTISSNKVEGAALYGSESSWITGNTLLSNEGYGVYLEDSAGNTLEGNNISSNWYGLHIFNGVGNSIHNNTFYDNSIHAVDDSNVNVWDNGYPSGGNYWDDYSGLDQLSGPNQDQPGSDGIGDAPYFLDPDTQDRYPLMCPSGVISPSAPSNLNAFLSGEGLENVTLVWVLSADDGGGSETVTGYQIFRGSTYHPNGTGYGVLATVPNGFSVYVDSLAGEGDESNYYYKVCAINSKGFSSCASHQAGKVSRPLQEGMNLVSVPLIQSDYSIGTVLQTARFDKAWTYDSLGRQWKSYMVFKPYNGGFGTVDNDVGIWVNVQGSSNLTVAGIVPLVTTVQLKEGWNLVGFPSFRSSYSVSDLKNETGATRVEGLDSSTPPYYLKVMNDGEYLQAGQGYWVLLDSDATWTITNL